MHAYICDRAVHALKRPHDVHAVRRHVEWLTDRPWASLRASSQPPPAAARHRRARRCLLVFCVWDAVETCFVLDLDVEATVVYVAYFDMDLAVFQRGGTVLAGRLLRPRPLGGGGWTFVADACLTPPPHGHAAALAQCYRPSPAEPFRLRLFEGGCKRPAPQSAVAPAPPPPPPRSSRPPKPRPFDGRLVHLAPCAVPAVERMLYLEPSAALPDIYDVYEAPGPHARPIGVASVQTLESSRRMRELFAEKQRLLLRCRYDPARRKWEPL